MKRKRLVAFIPVIIGSVILWACAAGNQAATEPTPSVETAAPSAAESHDDAGPSLEGLAFEKIGDKERVTFFVTAASGFDVDRDSDKSIVVKLKDMTVPANLQEKQGEGLLGNIRFVLPQQRTVNGERWACLQVELGSMVPYRIREDLKGYIVDFDVSSLPQPVIPQTVTATVAAAGSEKPASAMKTYEMVSRQTVEKQEAMSAGDEGIVSAEKPQYKGKRVTLDLQDANIKSVFRLLTEVSGINIVAGPDVKGTVTLYMKDVPWDQALDTILDINGLAKKEMGSIISILTLEKKQQDEQTRQAAEAAQVAAEQARKARELELNSEQGKLEQISIEAKIVEVNTNFARQLGVVWGGGFKGSWSNRDFGMMVGNSGAGTGKTVTSIGGIGVTGSGAAVNFPSSTVVATPAIGLIMGASNFILDASLQALETTGEGKIISSPKVTTLDGVEANIGQGEEIPYITTDKDGNRSVEMKDAKLELIVTPTITPEGKISLKIEASNKYADWNKTNVSNENPPLVASNVNSKVVIDNGGTIVVGGIFKTTVSESLTGVPFLSKIPILGWLFKYKTLTKEKRELLIFVTPRIVGGENASL
jgi:type IV pilus assembly protein PilQ